jgi:hypothetical protein
MIGTRCPSCDPEKPINERTEDSLAYVRRQVESGRQRGADMSKAEDLLSAAQFLCDAGSYEDAQRLIGEAGEMAGDIIIQYHTLLSTLRRSAKSIMDARESGADIDEAMRYMQLAEGAKERSEYKLGITYAIRGAEAAAGKKKPASAGDGWQSTL